ncbi:hypothetical protein [Methylobacterium sp. E-005]|nr:hypothetical protein [Methylobacterium sp. E-005]
MMSMHVLGSAVLSVAMPSVTVIVAVVLHRACRPAREEVTPH